MKNLDFGIYHVFNKSIAGFKIFNLKADFLRMKELCKYYQIEKPSLKFSRFKEFSKLKKNPQMKLLWKLSSEKKIVKIIAYWIMPTHLHFILKPLIENGISVFTSKILNSYTRYFNITHNRKGPLWEGRSKRILVKTDEQLLHLTRYIHLNPVTAHLVEKPEEWKFSSYLEYLGLIPPQECICEFEDVLEINPQRYRQFVEDRISYQRELAKIKALLLE